MLANQFFTLLKGRFDTSWEAKESDPETERKKLLKCLQNEIPVCTIQHMTVPCTQSQSLCLFLHALLYEISETGDTDRFHLITHCTLINYKINTCTFLRKRKKQQQQKPKEIQFNLLLKLHVQFSAQGTKCSESWRMCRKNRGTSTRPETPPCTAPEIQNT